MSDEIISRGVIEVELGDTGIDAGIEKIDRSIKGLAASAKAAGKQASEGLNQIGGDNQVAANIDKTTKQFISSVQRATAAAQAGQKGTAAYYESLANTRGINADAIKPFIAQLAAQEQQALATAVANKRLEDSTKFLANLKSQTTGTTQSASELATLRAAELGVAEAAAPMIARLREAEKANGAMGNSAKQTAFALRGLPAQFSDIAVSLQGGQQPFTVFLQQGAQIKDTFGGALPALRAMGGYVLGLVNPYTLAAAAVGGLAFAYYSGSEESSRLNKALITTGNIAGTTVAELTQQAAQVGKVTGQYALAREAVEALAGSGAIAGKNLQIALRGVVAGAELTGGSIKSLVTDFESIAKDPVKAITALNEKYNFLTVDIYKNIASLQEQGKTQEAATVAYNAFANALETRNGQVKDSLGYIESAWKTIKGAIAGATDEALNFGRAQSDARKLAAIDGKLNARIGIGSGKAFAVTGTDRTGLEAERKQLADNIAAANAAAAIAGKAQADQKKAIDQQTKLKEYITGSSRLTIAKQLEEENKAFASATAGFKTDSKEYRDALAAHKAAVDNINKKSIASAATAVNKEASAYASLSSSIKSLTDQNRLEAALGENATASQKARIKLDQDMAAGKVKLTTAHKAAIEADLQEAAASEVALKAVQATKEITQYVQQGTLARKESAAQLEIEYQLYGKTNDARDIATIAIKAQADAEQKIYDLKKAGFTLTEEQIQQLKNEASARAGVEQATLGQTRALAYAKQLSDDNKKFTTETIFDDKQRNAALLKIEDATWQERIKLAGDGTEAQKKLIDEYNVYYANQLNKPAIAEWRKSVEQYDDIFRKGFAQMVNGGTSTWKAFNTSLVTTFKTTVADQIYKLLLKPFVVKIAASILGVGGAATAGTAAASSVVGSAGALTGNNPGSASALSIFSGIKQGVDGLSGNIVGSIENLGASIANGQGGLADSIGGALGKYSLEIGYGLAYLPAAMSLLSGDVKGAAFQGAGAAIGSIWGPGGAAIGSVIGGFVGSLFGGGGEKFKQQGEGRSGSYQNGVFTAKQSAYSGKNIAGSATGVDALNKAFSEALGGLLKSFGLNDTVRTNSTIRVRRTSGALATNFSGGGASFAGQFGEDANVAEAFQQFVNQVLGPTLVQAIRRSKLPEGIRDLFKGFSKKAEVGNLLTATLALQDAQKGLADTFGLTVEQAAQVAKVGDKTNDQLIQVVINLAALGNASLTIGETLLKQKDSLINRLGDTPLPGSLKDFDAILKGIDTTTKAGIQSFAAMLAYRDQFVAFTGSLDTLKGGVKSAIYDLLPDGSKQQALKADLAKLFAENKIALPGSTSELIELGKTIDFTTKEGLDLAAVFPTLVSAFQQTQDAASSLIDSLVQASKYASLVDYRRAVAYAGNGIDLKKLPSYDVGTPFVRGDQVARIHNGERILTADDNAALMDRLRDPGSNQDALISEVRYLREEVALLRSNSQSENIALLGKTERIVSAVDQMNGDGVILRETNRNNKRIVLDTRVVT